MIRLLDGVDAGARLTTRAPSTTGTRRAVTQMTRWWLGGLALSKATCVVAATIVFSPAGGDISYPERGIGAAKGSLEDVLPLEL